MIDLIDKCYNKAFGTKQREFDNESYYPLFIVDEAFSLVDNQNLLDSLLDRYLGKGNYNYTINDISDVKSKVIQAKRKIKDTLLQPNIKIHYLLTLYYSDSAKINSDSVKFDIDETLKYLENIERDVKYDNDYKVSVIIVVDSKIDSDDPDLVAFLNKIQKNDFNIFVFTCDYGHSGADIVPENQEALSGADIVPENQEALIGSIVAAVVLSSHAHSAKTFHKEEEDTRSLLKSTVEGSYKDYVKDKSRFPWQSISAIFSDKRRDFVAYVLTMLCDNVEELSIGRVKEEASKIDIPLGDVQSFQETLEAAITAMPTITAKSKIKFPDYYSFSEACKLMFGREGYRAAEISCKITFANANALKNLSQEDDYTQRASELVTKVSVYRHDNLMDMIIKGVDLFIKQIQDEVSKAAVEYKEFVERQIDGSEYDLTDILEGYVKRFLKNEELSTKLDYWNALKTKINPSMIPDYSVFTSHVEEFKDLKRKLQAYQYSNDFDVQLNEVKGYTISKVLRLAEDEEFLKKLEKWEKEYVDSGTEKEFTANLASALSFSPNSALSRKPKISQDFGEFQIKGIQFVSEYWDFQ